MRHRLGVLLVRSAAIDERTRLWIAHLATEGTLCGLAAASVRRMVPHVPLVVSVYVDRLRRRKVEGVRQTRHPVRPGEATVVDDLPVTTRSETTLDVVACLPRAEAVPFAD